MQKRIEDALISMGVPASLSGFDFIKEAVLIIDRNGTNIKWTEVYEQIGEKYGKTSSQVERAIRHAFATVRSGKGDYEVVNHYIGFSATNNASSISLLYRTIKREMEESRKDDIKSSNHYVFISEERIREIVRETIKEILGGNS